MNISDVFTKKIWNVRLSEFPNRRKLVPTDEDNVYDVERHEGEVIEKGDLISNQALNDLENRIQNGFQAVIKSGGQTSSNCGRIQTLLLNFRNKRLHWLLVIMTSWKCFLNKVE